MDGLHHQAFRRVPFDERRAAIAACQQGFIRIHAQTAGMSAERVAAVAILENDGLNRAYRMAVARGLAR